MLGRKNESADIYSRYGGFEFFHSCIFELYNEMILRPEISLHFMDADIRKLSLHQTQFLVRQIGGPRLYQGKPIGWVHRRMEISDFQFREIAAAFEKVFLENGVSAQDTSVIMSFISAQKPKIVTVRWAGLDLILLPLYRFHAFMMRLMSRFRRTGSCDKAG